MLIRVKQVEERTSRKGAKFLAVELADGRTVFCWDSALFPLVRAGAVLDAEVENGRTGYLRLVRAKAAKASESGPVYETGAESDRGDKALRTAALLAAARVLAGQKPDAERVVKYAETFYAWLTG